MHQHLQPRPDTGHAGTGHVYVSHARAGPNQPTNQPSYTAGKRPVNRPQYTKELARTLRAHNEVAASEGCWQHGVAGLSNTQRCCKMQGTTGDSNSRARKRQPSRGAATRCSGSTAAHHPAAHAAGMDVGGTRHTTNQDGCSVHSVSAHDLQCMTCSVGACLARVLL